MTLDELKSFLRQRQARFDEKPIQDGMQLVCAGGEIFSYYPKSGKVVLGGKQTALSQAFQQWKDSGFTTQALTG